MDAKISQVPIVVTDQKRALEFYTEKVGFEKKTDFTSPQGYRYVTVGPKGQPLELALWTVGSSVNPEQTEAAKQWSPGRIPPIVLLVADCRGTHQELSERGVKFLQPPMDHPWGVSATFVDPDGNLFSVSQLKGWAAK